jgi:hypothetical protein
MEHLWSSWGRSADPTFDCVALLTAVPDVCMGSLSDHVMWSKKAFYETAEQAATASRAAPYYQIATFSLVTAAVLYHYGRLTYLSFLYGRLTYLSFLYYVFCRQRRCDNDPSSCSSMSSDPLSSDSLSSSNSSSSSSWSLS